jgi:hypothetical protein
VLCLGLTLAGSGTGAVDAAGTGDGHLGDGQPGSTAVVVDDQIAGEVNVVNVDGRDVGVGLADDGAVVAQSAPAMPETTVTQEAAPTSASASSEVVLSFSPARAEPAATLPATGPAASTDPVMALLAAVLVSLGVALVRIGRQRSSSAT